MSSSINDLYLIGNGFDMHHCINSSYNNFKDWLKDKDAIVFNRLFQVYEFDGGDLWSSLEENLGNIPIEAILEDYVSSPFLILLFLLFHRLTNPHFLFLIYSFLFLLL